MQQTTKYKLNLIEKSDTFSPDPLNQNTQKVENALSAATAHTDAGDRAEASARASADAALAQRVTALEAHHIYVGTYTGNGSTTDGQTINLGFTPAAVLLCNYNTQNFHMLTEENYVAGSSPGTIFYYTRIVEGGFWTKTGSPYGIWNEKNAKYHFIALV